jgi:hypothetical protein
MTDGRRLTLSLISPKPMPILELETEIDAPPERVFDLARRADRPR